jgi:membrane-bound lytic murein transglycosylase D
VADYWKVYNYLPRETRGYVPAFIAVNYIFAHAADHNLYPVAPTFCAYEMDTVQVCYPLDLDLLAKVTGTNATELRELNPTFKQGRVPDIDQPASIYLPADAVGDFVANEAQLAYSYRPTAVEVQAAAAPATAMRTHTVRRGESLGLIAQRNGVSVGQLRDWNDLRSDRIKPGQKLVIQQRMVTTAQVAEPAVSKMPEVTAEQVKTSASSKEVQYIYHVIQPGDTLWDIAQKYPGVTVEQIKRLNSGLNSQHLYPGKKIKIGIQQG